MATTITGITAYTGTIPDKSTQTPNDFANAIHPYLDYFNSVFTPQSQTFATQCNSFAIDMNNLASSAATSESNALTYSQNAENSANNAAASETNAAQYAQEAANTVATIPVGSLNDTVIATDRTWSSSKINSAISAAGGVEYVKKAATDYYIEIGQYDTSSYELNIINIDTDTYIISGRPNANTKSYNLCVMRHNTTDDSFTFSAISNFATGDNQYLYGNLSMVALDTTRFVVGYCSSATYLRVFQLNADDTFTAGTEINPAPDHINYNMNIFKIGTDKVLVRYCSDVGIFNISGTNIAASGGTTVVETNSTSYNCGDMIEMDIGKYLSYSSATATSAYFHWYTFDTSDNVSVVDSSTQAYFTQINSRYSKLIKVNTSDFWFTGENSSYNNCYAMQGWTFDGTAFTNTYNYKYLLSNERPSYGTTLNYFKTTTATYIAVNAIGVTGGNNTLKIVKLPGITLPNPHIQEDYGLETFQILEKYEWHKYNYFCSNLTLSNGKILYAIDVYNGTEHGFKMSAMEVL